MTGEERDAAARLLLMKTLLMAGYQQQLDPFSFIVLGRRLIRALTSARILFAECDGYGAGKGGDALARPVDKSRRVWILALIRFS